MDKIVSYPRWYMTYKQYLEENDPTKNNKKDIIDSIKYCLNRDARYIEVPFPILKIEELENKFKEYGRNFDLFEGFKGFILIAKYPGNPNFIWLGYDYLNKIKNKLIEELELFENNKQK